MSYLFHYLSISILVPLLFFLLISGDNIGSEDLGDTANKWDEEQSFLYHLSTDKKH